jgi:tetratricopeptide (TPR) repeat protein
MVRCVIWRAECRIKDSVIEGEIMNKEESISVSNHEMLKALKGKYLCAQKQLQQARSKWQRRRLKEHFDDLQMNLAWTLLDCGKHEEGLALYISVCGRQYRERKYNGIGRALTEMKHYDEARRILEKGLKEFPESCSLWTGLGILHDLLGDHFESLKCFEAATEFDSEKSSGPLYNKALALMGLGSHADAVSIIDHLIGEHPEEPKYLADRGNCAVEAGYPREALQYYQKAMALFSESPDTHTGVCIYAGFCFAYLELGMKREAMEIALEGLKRFPDEDSALYHNAGAAFFEMGWRKEAMEILKKGVEKFPEDEEMRKFLKDIEDDMDDPDKGDKPPLLGVLLLMALIYKRMRKK